MTESIEYDENYDPSHKSSSINSIDSIPSLCSTSTAGEQDDELKEPSLIDQWVNEVPLDSKRTASLSIPFDDETAAFDLTANFVEPALLAVATAQMQKKADDTATVAMQADAKAGCLSKDERRANHIASEQKRRQNIKNGFQQMTELIPSLKNMPHSKSTILFKAADYIKHCEKRNKGLRERLRQLQQRLALTSMAYDRVTPNSYASTQKRIRLLQQQLLQQQRLLLLHNILPPGMNAQPAPQLTHANHNFMQNTSMLMPQQQQQQQHSAITMPSSPTFASTPCLNIPADDEDASYHQHQQPFLQFHS